MRQRIKDLIAKAGKPKGLPQGYRSSRVLPSKPKAQLTDIDILKLSLRELALSRGIPRGFHRWPTLEEYARIDADKKAEQKKINRKLGIPTSDD